LRGPSDGMRGLLYGILQIAPKSGGDKCLRRRSIDVGRRGWTRLRTRTLADGGGRRLATSERLVHQTFGAEFYS
jgi:hypothetical protein